MKKQFPPRIKVSSDSQYNTVTLVTQCLAWVLLFCLQYNELLRESELCHIVINIS